MDFVVREAMEADVKQADRVLRLAFGSQDKLDDPLTSLGDRDMISHGGNLGTAKSLCSNALI